MEFSESGDAGRLRLPVVWDERPGAMAGTEAAAGRKCLVDGASAEHRMGVPGGECRAGTMGIPNARGRCPGVVEPVRSQGNGTELAERDDRCLWPKFLQQVGGERLGTVGGGFGEARLDSNDLAAPAGVADFGSERVATEVADQRRASCFDRADRGSRAELSMARSATASWA
jgi:hypothetical protein